jgi:hypothetical protein
MGVSQRTKGHNFERKIARVLQGIYPDAKRGFQTRGGGKEQADIIGVAPDIHFECSIGGESIWAKWHQAKMDAPAKTQVVVKQRDREKPVVLLSLRSFLSLLGAYESTFRASGPLELRVLERYEEEFGA